MRITYILDKFSFLQTRSHGGRCSSLLFKVSTVCIDALLRPCLHVEHGSPDHRRVNQSYLPGDVGLQLVEVGGEWGVDIVDGSKQNKLLILCISLMEFKPGTLAAGNWAAKSARSPGRKPLVPRRLWNSSARKTL